MTFNYLECQLARMCLSLSMICTREAKQTHSPNSKITLIQHATDFLNIALNYSSDDPTLTRAGANK